MLAVLWTGNKLRYPEKASRRVWASTGQGRKSPVQKCCVQDKARKRRDLSPLEEVDGLERCRTVRSGSGVCHCK